jgi:protein-S-isoprenylcysteine O-methyltransferase Ste14
VSGGGGESKVPLALRTAIFVVVFPGSVTVLGPFLILRSTWDWTLSIGAGRYAGDLPIALGVPILLWCFADFVGKGRGTPAPWDAPRQLVTRGLYRSVRNPMYVGIVLVLVGEALVFRSGAVLAYAGVIWLMFHLFATLYEEPELERRFGESYREYKALVNRWIPKFPEE